MPFIYFGTGWFIGIALASALHLPIELLLPAFLVPISGLFLWRTDHHARLIWISVIFALCGGIWFTLCLPGFEETSELHADSPVWSTGLFIGLRSGNQRSRLELERAWVITTIAASS